MGRDKAARVMSCTALLTLLAASGYLGARPAQTATVSVPMTVETVSAQALAAASLEETKQALAASREEALALLESVIGDPDADEEAKEKAFSEKTAIAVRMEKEAALAAVLSQMGFGETAAVLSEEAVTLIVPWQAAENEQNRVRMIDAATAQTGMPAACVKIILSKK